jgi:hypothetical protein
MKSKTWYWDERCRKPLVLIHLTRRQWKFFRHVKNVESSLDALFGAQAKPKIRFTER